MDDKTHLVDLLHDQPPGTCLALRDGSGEVLVRGRNGRTFTVNPVTGSCPCLRQAGWHARYLTDCYHLRTARKHLEETLPPCPACHGDGIARVSPREMTQHRFTPRRCFSCQGSGVLTRQAFREVA